MDLSDNLISLSDSGVGTSPSLSDLINKNIVSSSSEHGNENNTGVFDVFGDKNEDGECVESDEKCAMEEGGMGTGLLIDFSDEVQVSQPQGILLQAEIDDTFGIFSMAQQSRQKSAGNTNNHNLTGGTPVEEAEDEAAKLVRSFTSGRKSDGVKAKKKKEEEEKNKKEEEEKKKDDPDNKSTDNDTKCFSNSNVSVESIGSDQPTIVDSDDALSPTLPGADKEEKGIMDEKMKLDNTSTSSNFSGGSGSDSDFLDIRNLSSFSIPDEDESMDENKFIEDIKRENMASSSTTKAIMNKIKLQMMEDQIEDEDENYLARARFRSNRFSEEHDLLSDLTRPSLAATTTSSTVRFSSSSVTSSVSTSSRMSTRGRRSSSSGFGDVPVSTSTFLCGNDGADGLKKSSTMTARARLSCNFGSPIRSSYPMSKYFMPTPKAKTPSTAAYASRVDYRDRLSESLLYSPSRTRVMLITGDSHRSPSRVPVRKSISAETLHYEYSSPVRDMHRQMVKFSTPSASSKSRHSFSNQPAVLNHPNFFGDDRPGDNKNGGGQSQDLTLTDRIKTSFMEPRLGPLSFATTASTSSINTSPAGSSIFSRDLSILSSQLNRSNLGDSPSKSVATVQPVRATAIIAPNAKPIFKPPAVGGSSTTGLVMPPKITVSGQSGTHRPIAASSPKTGQSSGKQAANQTTPSRSKYASSNIRSSGYGAQQNLNSSISFGSSQPLKSPNKAIATIKAPAIPKSLKTGVLSFSSKLDVGTRGGGATTARTSVSALKPGIKIPTLGTAGLRRPATTGTASSASAAGSNKENRLRSATSAPATSRIGVPRQAARQ